MVIVDANIVRGIGGGLGLVLFYAFSFWRIFKGNPGDRVIQCGSITLMVFVVMLALFKIPNFPVWVLAWLGVFLFSLCLLTMFFLVQQGYRALRRRKKDGTNPINSPQINVGQDGSKSMTAKEAKDFLVQQTAEQATLEGISISDLEKRMMYFVENDSSSCANPLELNEEFEAQYDTEKYEAKIASLLHHAYKRLKSEDPGKVCHWDSAIRTLSSGDHYLPVLWRADASSDHPFGHTFTPLRKSLPLLLTGLLVAAVLIVAAFFAAKYHSTLDRFLPPPLPGLRTILFTGIAVGACLLFYWVRAKHDRSSH